MQLLLLKCIFDGICICCIVIHFKYIIYNLNLKCFYSILRNKSLTCLNVLLIKAVSESISPCQYNNIIESVLQSRFASCCHGYCEKGRSECTWVCPLVLWSLRKTDKWLLLEDNKPCEFVYRLQRLIINLHFLLCWPRKMIWNES